MAVLIGNLTLLLDPNSPRTGLLDRKIIPQIALDLLLNLPKSKRDSLQINNAPTTTLSASSLATSGFESDKSIGSSRDRVRKRSNSKVNAVDFDAYSSDEENGNGVEEEEEEEEEEKEDFNWEKNMRKRIKELEEMKELEKKAEELRSRMEEEDDLGGFNGGETEEEKRMRVRKELEKVAKEQAERQATAKLMFELGQKAYGRGMYGRATEFLEGALTIIPKPTVFGGEIQIWLAMAYDANNRHADCIDLYRQLENTHPSIMIRRQASELRYILQAPKLKISKEEMVSIPLIGSSYDSYAGTWTDKKKGQGPAFSGETTNQISSSRDFLGDFPIWRPPVEWKSNQVFWAALAVTVGLAGVALLQR